MEDIKIKVVWITEFRNNEIGGVLQNNKSLMYRVINCFKRGSNTSQTDSAQWVTNGINEFKKYNDIELHVITYASNLNKRVVDFTIDGINYHIYNSSYYSIAGRLRRKLGMKDPEHTSDRKVIKRIVERVNPDIIHIIGAENPEYSLAALDAPTDKPLLVSLQTLMNAPGFFENYPISKEAYEYRSFNEKRVLGRADYIGTRNEINKEHILKYINAKAVFLDLRLAIGIDPIIDKTIEKKYDFVYFANNINKAFDYALECFAIAKKTHPQITMNVIGSYSDTYIQKIKQRISELGITEAITFEGRLKTHTDVMLGIQKSRFALIPLKVDLISGTVREAMRHGLPTISTITPLTPELNAKRESILLSKTGDYEAMANDMCRLIENELLSQQLSENGIQTIDETFSNKAFMEQWRKAYYEILDNFHRNIEFSKYVQKK